MRRQRISWVFRTAAVVGLLVSLGIGAKQATAASSRQGCQDCAGFGRTLECDFCCGGPGFCTLAHICIC